MNLFPVTKTTNTRINNVNWDNLGFGVYFSDHMFMSDYVDGKWDDGAIVPYGAMQIEPALCTLHYGQTIFEGLKAFRSVRGGVNIFRPHKNAARLNYSADRLCIPRYDTATLIDAMKELVKIDSKWVPSKRTQSLYFRPFVFGSGNFLGVQVSSSYRLIIMTSPVASYYPDGMAPVKILVSSEYARAVRGGLGAAKTAANYASSLLGGKKAKEMGFAQVLWLDAVSRAFIDEVGAMNIVFVIDGELITPPLDNGTILNGVTRDTVITLAKDWGMKVSERLITVEEVFEAHNDGKLNEVFGTGTAAVISPVGLLSYRGNNITINDNQIGPIAQRLYDTITGIQHSEIEDIYGWNVHVDLFEES
ncbi:MAG: branched-chain amino acid aminotransferase [Candidatus Kapabacteria bacterium]|nr:branched-chain amino acid aminotransferase [Candidatus Kapabacteria bacterium]